ncbi:MAG: SDR family oxidoreductase [Ginsengibacter sp.]
MKNIVISGGSKGIGKAIALRYAAAGNNIFISSRNENLLSKTAEEIVSIFPQSIVKFFAADLSKRRNAIQFSEFILKYNGTPDVLINNAGTFLPGSIYNEESGTLEAMIENNLYSAYYLTRAILPAMMAKKSGHIFNLCSIASLKAYANGGSYSISKFALMGFSKNLREELKPANIKVTAVYPGAVFTDSWEGAGIEEKTIIASNDIAELIFTASNLSTAACVEEIVVRPIGGDI